MLDNIYVEVPFSRVSVSTGENPILIPGAMDPYKESFMRPPPNRTKPVEEEQEEKKWSWSSFINRGLSLYNTAKLGAASFLFKRG